MGLAGPSWAGPSHAEPIRAGPGGTDFLANTFTNFRSTGFSQFLCIQLQTPQIAHALCAIPGGAMFENAKIRISWSITTQPLYFRARRYNNVQGGRRGKVGGIAYLLVFNVSTDVVSLRGHF